MTQVAVFEDWFQDFKINRIVIKSNAKIDGRPLYGYQLTTEELESLKKIFSIYYRGLTARNVELNKYYGAAFVLLGSEFFRRNYERQWNWDAIYQFMGITIKDVAERTNLIESGFKYWQLPTIESDAGKSRDFLGSVMNQGGLPWRLVQNNEDSFGKVIQLCFSDYAELIEKYGSLIPAIKDLADRYRLPDYLSNSLTFDLIAGVVETVVGLQRKYPDIAIVEDPFKYLSEKEPDWIYEFPIPLDEDNAKNLLKSWFKHAKEQINKRASKRNDEDFFIAENFWEKDLDSDDLARLVTKVIQPHVLTITADKMLNKPTSLRLELLVYEGNNVLAKGRYFYAEMNQDNALIIKSRSDTNSFLLKRKQPYTPLTIKLISAGMVIYEEGIAESALSEYGMPLFFTKTDQEYKCIADAGSFSTAHVKGYLYLPNDFVVETPAYTIKSEEDTLKNYEYLYRGENASWIEVYNFIQVNQQSSELSSTTFLYEANSKDPSKAIHLAGKEDLELQSSRYIYRDFPDLQNAPEGTIEYVNGQELKQFECRHMIGNVNYQAKTKDGRILLMRRFAILPKSFKVCTDNIDLQHEVLKTRVYLNTDSSSNESNIHFRVEPSESIAFSEISKNNFQIDLLNINNIPSAINIALESTHHNEPLILSVPLSIIGIKIQKDHTYLSERRISLSLDEMLGHDIVLQAPHNIMRVNVMLQLHSKGYKNDRVPLLTRSVIRPISPHVRLNLVAFKDEIERLMSIVDDLDAYITLTIQSQDLGSVEVNLSRFHVSGELSVFNQLLTSAEIRLKGVQEHELGSISFRWISLLNPSIQFPLTIGRTYPVESEAINITFQEPLMDALGLIISDAASEVSLRPILRVDHKRLEKESADRDSIEYAVINFHPVSHKNSFDHVFELMAIDLDYEGWKYFEALVKNVPENLSLSTFAAWKCLVRNHQLLTLAFFKLNLDADFCLRIQNELSLVWEAISYQIWSDSIQYYARYIFDKYSLKTESEESNTVVLLTILKTYTDRLKAILPAQDIVINAIYGNGVKNPLTEDSLFNMRQSKNALIKHNEDNTWPIYLEESLIHWFKSVVIGNDLLPDSFLKVLVSKEEPHYHYSSLLLPVYMAAVSSGVSKFGDLLDYQESNHEEFGRTDFELMAELKFAYQQLSYFDSDWYNVCYKMALIGFMGEA